MISKSYRVDGNLDALDNLLNLKIEYGKLLANGKISDEQARKNSYTQGVNEEVERYTKSLKTPPKADPNLQKEIEDSKKYLQTTEAAYDRIKMLEADFKQQSGREREETAKRIHDLHLETVKRDQVLKDRYTEILKKDEYNVEANFGMSQVLRNQGDYRESQMARMRAMFHATPEQRKQIDSELQAKFLGELKMYRSPERKNSLYLTRLRADFRDEFVEPTDSEFKDIAEQSTIMSKALEWAKKKAQPLTDQINQVTGVDVWANE